MNAILELICTGFDGLWGTGREPKARMKYCNQVLSVVPPSLTSRIFDFSSATAERNRTKLDRQQVLNVRYQVCVFRRLIGWGILDFHHQQQNGMLWNLTGSKYSTISTKFLFIGSIRLKDCGPRDWLADTVFTSPLLHRFWRNFTGSKYSASSTKSAFLDKSFYKDGDPCPWLAKAFWLRGSRDLFVLRSNSFPMNLEKSRHSFL